MAERIACERTCPLYCCLNYTRWHQMPSKELLKMTGQEPLAMLEKELNIIGREIA
jgi:hypothetical protein